MREVLAGNLATQKDDQDAGEELAGGLSAGLTAGLKLVPVNFCDRAGSSASANQRRVAGAGRRQRVDVDAADRALLELDRVPRADEPRGELADARLVADERDARLARVLLEIGDDRRVAAAGRQRVDR